MGADLSKNLLVGIGTISWLVGPAFYAWASSPDWKAGVLCMCAFFGLLLACIAFAIDNDEVKTRNGIFRIIEYLLISILGLFILGIQTGQYSQITQGVMTQIWVFWVLAGFCIIDLIGDVTDWYSTVHISVSV